jgi:hypothetical protein
MKKPEIDFLVEYDDQSILAELRRIAKATGSNTVTKADLERVGRVSHGTVVKRFGTLRQALSLASLKSGRFMKGTDEELLAIINLWQQVLEKEGRTPQRDDLKAYGFSVSGDTITRRFGSWRKALVRARDSITEDSVSADEQPVATVDAPRKRVALSLTKRFFVLKRDHFACVRCGASGVGVRIEVHHRFPFAKGGSDHLSNLETLCWECNRGQRDSVV